MENEIFEEFKKIKIEMIKVCDDIIAELKGEKQWNAQ